MITESNDMKYNAYPHSMFAAQPEEDGCSKKGFITKVNQFQNLKPLLHLSRMSRVICDTIYFFSGPSCNYLT